MNLTSFKYGETKSSIQSASKTHLSETPKNKAEGLQHEDFYPRDRVKEGFLGAGTPHQKDLLTCPGQRGATATYVFLFYWLFYFWYVVEHFIYFMNVHACAYMGAKGCDLEVTGQRWLNCIINLYMTFLQHPVQQEEKLFSRARETFINREHAFINREHVDSKCILIKHKEVGFCQCFLFPQCIQLPECWAPKTLI